MWEEKRKRSLRRHHIKRLKNKRSEFYNNWAKNNDKAKGKLAHTATICSCDMCGNPRKHFGGETIQETQSKVRLKEWLEEAA